MDKDGSYLDRVRSLDINDARSFFADHLKSDQCGLCGFEAWLVSGVRHPEGPEVETQFLLHGHELDKTQAIGSCTPLVSLECARCGHMHTFNKGRIVDWLLEHEGEPQPFPDKFANIGLHPDTFTKRYANQRGKIAGLETLLPEALLPRLYAWRMRNVSPFVRTLGNVTLALGGIFYFCLMVVTLVLAIQGDTTVLKALLGLGLGSLIAFAVGVGVVWLKIRRA